MIRDYVKDYDIKMRNARRLVRERAGRVIDVNDFLLITEDPNEAELLLKAIKQDMDGYVFMLVDEDDWGYPFELKVSDCVREGFS